MLKKKIFTAILCFFALCFVFAGESDLKVTISPARPQAGEIAALKFTLNSRGDIELPRVMPKVDGITWQRSISQSSSVSIVNGVMSAQKTYQISFCPEKPGDYTIPAIECTVKGEKVKTDPISFSVTSAPEYEEIEDSNVGLQILIDGSANRTVYYTGEMISLKAFFICRGGSITEVPNITASMTPAQAQPLRFIPEKQFVNAGRFVLQYQAQFCPVREGTYKIQAETTGKLKYDTGFFILRFRAKTAKDTEIVVKKTPAVPGNAVPLNIRGESVQMVCDPVPEKGVKGEPITLKMDLRGKANYSGLRLKQLDLDGCANYPPEVKASGAASCQVLFTFTPTKPGKLSIDKTFAFFDVISGDYKTASFKGEIDVSDSNIVMTAPQPQPPASREVARPEPGNGATAPQDGGLRYLKNTEIETVSVPVWKNNLILNLAIVLGGALIALVVLLIRSWKGIAARLSSTDSEKSVKSSALKALKRMPAQGIDEATMRALMAALATALEKDGLPKDSSDSDILDCLQKRDPELAESLRALSGNLWLPDSVKRTFDSAFYRKLLASLGKILILCLCCLATFTVSAAETPEQLFRQEYDRGNYEKCIEILDGRLSAMGKAESSPGLLCRLGTCHAAINTPEHNARALAYLEQAHKLAPRDADILANLNHVRGQLGLPGKYPLDSFSNCMVRALSTLRPDETLTILAIALALLFIALTLKRHPVKTGLIWLAVIVIVVSAGAFFAQNFLIYNDNEAVVVEKAPIYRIPVKMEREEIAGEFALGTIVKISTVRGDRVLVQSESGSGWISKDKILRY